MPEFSRRTILAAADVLAGYGHTGVDRFLLEYGLEDTGVGGSLQARANALSLHLLANPQQRNEDGRNLTDAIVGELINHAIRTRVDRYSQAFDYQAFQQSYSALHRGLERDGFTVEGGVLRRMLPEILDLPAADDEVHTLLNYYHLAVPVGHLDQAIAAHARGDWAAANAQFRPFVESLMDEIAAKLAGSTGVLPPPGQQRRQWLAQLNPPFLLVALNEWTGQGTGFFEGFYRRLHPHGAHPGLSDEDDSTFRLHLVLLVARLFLRRLQHRIV
jgi:hypothetical protein